MLKNKELVSRIVNDLNALTKDVHISKRWLLSIAQTKAESYVLQRWDDASFFEDKNLLTCVGCVEMIEVDAIDCCIEEFKLCSVLMRSKYRLPGLLYSAYGPTITKVSNVDGTIFFKYMDIERYRLQQKRRFASKLDRNFFVWDGYLWIPDFHIELVNLCYFTMKRREALAISACGEKPDPCVSEWDYEFLYPIKLIEYIVSETVQEALSKIQIPDDDNPDLDTNQKTSTSNLKQ